MSKNLNHKYVYQPKDDMKKFLEQQFLGKGVIVIKLYLNIKILE